MAKQDLLMPQMGESITTGTITKWHKAPGDMVAIDDIILEISTDKVESEIPSPFEGRVEKILFEEGETIDVGKAIAVIEDDPENVAFEQGATGTTSDKKKAPSEQKNESSSQKNISSSQVSNEESKKQQSTESGRRFYTPLVRAMAKEAGVDLSELEHLKGSGAGGRVNKSDFEKYIADGRPSKGSSAASVSQSSIPAFTKGERVEVIPMDNMRKTIARNMQQSKQISPHVNSIDEVDMTNLVKQREALKNDFKKEEGFALTYTHFILYALVQALKEFPSVNASIDGDNIVLKKDINLGCAVAVPGNGLVVPVIKGADNLNMTGLARALNDLVVKARNKKLTMDDLSGGSYTFTNNGSFGVLAATPVILQPQLGIFCVGAIKKRPIVTQDDALAIRQMMYATHTYDHRLIDGELGSKFLRHTIKSLEQMDVKSLL